MTTRGRVAFAACIVLTLVSAAIALDVMVAPRAGRIDAAPSPPSADDGLDLRHNGDSVTVPAGSPYRKRILVGAVEQRSTAQTIVLPAQVEADPVRVHNVLPPLGGRVVELKVELGDHVKKDQPLLVISSGDLAQVYSDASKATAQADLAHRALDRARGLIKAGGGSVKDFEAAVNDAAQADTELARAQSRLTTIVGSSAPSGARTLTILSPADGVITALAIAPDAYINDPTQSIMTVSSLDRVWVTAGAPESNIGFIAKGQPVDVQLVAYPNQVFHGTVLFANDIMEADTRRTKVRIAFVNTDGRFKPNMFATVTLHGPLASTLLVPNGALLMDNDSTSVFVETAPWTFTRRRVGLGYETEGRTVITSGLSAGDRVVVSGGVLLND